MIDPSTLPYVDLSNSPEILRAYSIEHFGKKINTNAKDATVRERFSQIYKEETGVDLAPYDPAADAAANLDDDDDDIETAKPAAKEKPKFKYAIVQLQEDPLDPHPVKLGLNFRAFLIKRNEEVKVPFALVGVLRDAKRAVFDQKTMAQKEVPAYPFSILGYTDED